MTWAALPFVIQAHGSSPDLAIQFLTADTGSILFDERTFTTRTGWGHWSEYPEPRFGPMTYLDHRHWVMGLPDALAGTVRIAETTDAGRTWTTHTRPIPKTTNLSVSFVSAMTWIATIETTSGPPTNKVEPCRNLDQPGRGKDMDLHRQVADVRHLAIQVRRSISRMGPYRRGRSGHHQRWRRDLVRDPPLTRSA